MGASQSGQLGCCRRQQCVMSGSCSRSCKDDFAQGVNLTHAVEFVWCSLLCQGVRVRLLAKFMGAYYSACPQETSAVCCTICCGVLVGACQLTLCGSNIHEHCLRSARSPSWSRLSMQGQQFTNRSCCNSKLWSKVAWHHMPWRAVLRKQSAPARFVIELMAKSAWG